MGLLVPHTTFRKWQAVINNSKVVARVSELRKLTALTNNVAVTHEDHMMNVYQVKEMAQMDLLTNFLLDMNDAEPLLSDSVIEVDLPMPPDKEPA